MNTTFTSQLVVTGDDVPGTQPYMIRRNAGTQTFLNATGTPLVFDTLFASGGGSLAPTYSSGDFLINTDGLYAFSASINITSGSVPAGTFFQFLIGVVGGTRIAHRITEGSGAVRTSLFGTRYCTTGDVIQVIFYQSTGGDITASANTARFGMVKIS